ncbi:MAG: polymer-forming cytoskeletal protein [Candidatus Adiutrix sp.]|jgi:cytoskeletal protein CcmA (bactofilin family)|nr:polymer-forming cytoskeletal protein [Candidatus Adiutrix sp.]
MVWGSKKKDPGYSYFATGVTLEGRLCFSGIVRLDGRVNGEIISTGTLVVEETAVITGDVLVENIILGGTVYGNIQASRQVQLTATAKVYGHINYGELSIEGAVHEGSSHKLTPDESALVQRDCAELLEEAAAMAALSTPDSSALEQYSVTLGAVERQAASALVAKKNGAPAPRKPAALPSAKGGPAQPAKNGGDPARAAEAPAKNTEPRNIEKPG